MDNKNCSEFLKILCAELETGTDNFEEFISYRHQVDDYIGLGGNNTIIPSKILGDIYDGSKNHSIKQYTVEYFNVARSGCDYGVKNDSISDLLEEEFETANLIASNMKLTGNYYTPMEVTKVREYFEHTIKIISDKYKECKNKYHYSIVTKSGNNPDEIMNINLVLIKLE